MSPILSGLALAAVLPAAAVIARARSALRMTTLTAAWRWALAAIALWVTSVLATGFFNVGNETGSLLWFATALFSLCPAIAVLGARRPGAGAWTWFVLIPLIAVLGWPALTLWESGAPSRPLQLETPQLIGFAVVLLMGAGNYLGTRFWASALLYGLSIVLLVVTLSDVAMEDAVASMCRAAACVAIGLATLIALRQRGPKSSPTSDLDRLWVDYRDAFGIVWARRLQDRLNVTAEQKQWPVRLTPIGFQWNDSVSEEARAECFARIEHSLRWMLRRFVAPEWIDQRLGKTATGDSA